MAAWPTVSLVGTFDHLAVAGPGEQPPQPLKSGLIPVRFTPDMIAAVKRVASQDGVTVSTWIRR